jgi:GNAT superfamily N-acetyltransferase
MKETRGEFTLSTEPGDQQPERIHAYLTRSYWAEGISLELVQRSVANSLCFGLFRGGDQIGLARVVTDKATFAYLCDVYVLEEYRGRGLAQWMIGSILSFPELQGLRRFMLATRDAHTLYTRFGFNPPDHPESLLEIRKSGMYRKSKQL